MSYIITIDNIKKLIFTRTNTEKIKSQHMIVYPDYSVSVEKILEYTIDMEYIQKYGGALFKKHVKSHLDMLNRSSGPFDHLVNVTPFKPFNHVAPFETRQSVLDNKEPYIMDPAWCNTSEDSNSILQSCMSLEDTLGVSTRKFNPTKINCIQDIHVLEKKRIDDNNEMYRVDPIQYSDMHIIGDLSTSEVIKILMDIHNIETLESKLLGKYPTPVYINDPYKRETNVNELGGVAEFDSACATLDGVYTNDVHAAVAECASENVTMKVYVYFNELMKFAVASENKLDKDLFPEFSCVLHTYTISCQYLDEFKEYISTYCTGSDIENTVMSFMINKERLSKEQRIQDLIENKYEIQLNDNKYISNNEIEEYLHIYVDADYLNIHLPRLLRRLGLNKRGENWYGIARKSSVDMVGDNVIDSEHANTELENLIHQRDLFTKSLPVDTPQ